MKKALVTGITGQDGSYIAELLLEKGYEVHGIKRRASSFNTSRVEHLYQDEHVQDQRFFMHFGDLSDSLSIQSIIEKTQPDEIYNLGAMSHVQVSFEQPEYVAQVDGLGALRILEGVRQLGMGDKTKIYQASTSELYGLVQQTPQNENTPFYPRSPYGVAKLYAYWISVNYREAYGMFISNGLLFNHESPRRGETFVTRKIVRAAAKIAAGFQSAVYLGNLDSKRDWGHAKDYVEAQWLILQHDVPDDWVIATGVTTTVRDFLVKVFARLGIGIKFCGTGLDEVGVVDSVEGDSCLEVGQVILKIDPRYFRPTEVDLLLGDATKARDELGWEPSNTLEDLIEEMVASELLNVEKMQVLMDHGFDAPEALNERFE